MLFSRTRRNLSSTTPSMVSSTPERASTMSSPPVTASFPATGGFTAPGLDCSGGSCATPQPQSLLGALELGGEAFSFRYCATSTGPRFGNLSRTNAAKPATVGRCLASTLKRALTCGRIRAVDSYYIRFDSSICGWPRLLYSCFCSGTRTEENTPRP